MYNFNYTKKSLKSVGQYLFLISLFSSIVITGYGQDSQFTVSMSDTLGENMFTKVIFQFSKKHILYEKINQVPEGITSHKVYRFSFNPVQTAYERILEGKGGVADSILVQLQNKKTLTNISHSNYFDIFVGINEEYQKIIIVDSNRNLNFTDDDESTFYFDRNSYLKGNDSLKIETFFSIEYDTFIDGQITKQISHFKLIPFGNVNNINGHIANNLLISLVPVKYYTGNVKIRENQYQIALRSPHSLLNNIEIIISGFDTSSGNNTLVFRREAKLDDFIYFEGWSIHFKSWNPSTNILSVIFSENKPGSNPKYGKTVTEHAYNFTAKKLDSITLNYSLDSLRGKYVILDFWGFWCKPCLDQLPNLKKIHENFKESPNFQLVGVNFPINTTLNTLRQKVITSEIPWMQLVDDGSSNIGPIQRLNITTYPTYILLSPEGEILVRGSSKQSLTQMTELLEEALQNK